MGSEPIILLRVTSVGPRERDFADLLAACSSLEIVYLVDGRNGAVAHEARSLIAINDVQCERLGLYMTKDYAWRCGDYGLYLARERFAEASAFWIIEGDVRISGQAPEQFFEAMKSSHADLLAAYLKPAPPDHFWRPFGEGRGVVPYQCLFSMVRISARLTDALLEKRRSHGRSRWRTKMWPNDEVFVATTAAQGMFAMADLNAVKGPWYSVDRYAYDVTIDGDALPADGKAQLLHSVRWGADVTNRVIHPPLDGESLMLRRIVKRVVPLLKW